MPDVLGAFNRLSHHGDILGFHMGAGAADVSVFRHWQGVQRLTTGGGQYLVVSRSGARQMFAVVQMASRGSGGGRWRSNRKDPVWAVESTAPPVSDAIVRVVAQDSGYDHAGGIQSLGRYLAVPIETDGRSKVIFFDMSTPAQPTRLHELDHTTVNGVRGIGQAGTVSLTKLRDGRFIAIVGRAHAEILDFYISSGTRFERPEFQFFSTLSVPGRLGSTISDWNWGAYQSLNLVNQCDGRLFLIGTNNTGRDWADLFRLDINAADRGIAITKVAKRHMYCGYNGTNHCNFQAAAGVYVAPDQGLYLYAVEHDNDGPQFSSGPTGGSFGSVKMEEFRPNPHRRSCPNLYDAWVELFDDSDLQDRSLMIDFIDHPRENEANYDQFEDFEDRASSARWCIPSGYVYRLYEHKNPCRGRYVDLPGTGAVQTVRWFGDFGFNDKVSCSLWWRR
ncbi:MAG TPA: hypothetical protein PKI03_19095 [Pseudomonadota bacterium]|nr:hypothetical protein [Pseudomonadota bacterium]